MRQLRALFRYVFFAALALPSAARAEIPRKLEPDYAQAVLSYNAKNFGKTLRLLNALVRQSPDTLEFYELKALTLRQTKDEKASGATYLALIERKTRLGRPEKEMAAYHFELGMISHRQLRADDAKVHFQFAVRNFHNIGPASLYLGMYAFKSGAWAEAGENFRAVVDSTAEDLKSVAYFYLGQTYLKTGYSSGATSALISARSSARATLEDPESGPEARKIARQIEEASGLALAPFDKSAWFGSISLLTGYDSNLIAVPSSVTSVEQTSGKASAKENLAAGVGYATSPLSWLQFVPSYRMGFQFNFNKAARGAEFLDHNVSLYVTRNPLLRFSFGALVSGAFVFKNDVDLTTDSSAFRPFSKSLSVGPYAKYELLRYLSLGAELTIGSARYDQDSTTGDTQRSGGSSSLRFYLAYDPGARYLNPIATVRFDNNQTDGREFRGGGASFELQNIVRLRDDLTLTGALALTGTSYKERAAGERKDNRTVYRVTVSWKLGPKWTFVGSGDLTHNKSTVDSLYTYDRTSFGAGVSFSF